MTMPSLWTTELHLFMIVFYFKAKVLLAAGGCCKCEVNAFKFMFIQIEMQQEMILKRLQRTSIKDIT